MAVPVARYSVRRQKELELRHELRTMREAIDKYKQMSDAGLIPMEIGGEGYPPDLDKLVEGVNLVGQIEKKQRFLRRIPIDPDDGKAEWGMRAYQDDAGHVLLGRAERLRRAGPRPRRRRWTGPTTRTGDDDAEGRKP